MQSSPSHQNYWAMLLGILTTITVAYGCTPQRNETQKQPIDKEVLDITVSVEPQKYFVEKIGGDRVKVNVMVPAGSEPHTYEPKPQQLRDLAKAEAYIIVGGDSFETAWLPRIKSVNNNLAVIDSGEGVARIKIDSAHHHHHHHHHEEEEKVKESGDPHIWLAPSAVKIQAKNIYEGLIKIDPANQLEYEQNLEEFITEIDSLDDKIETNLAGIKNRKFIVFHPAWSYFAREYNLEQIAIEVEGTEPSAAELKDLIATAKKENIKIIFIEPQFSQRSAEVIAKEIDGKVIEIDPLAPDWANNLLKVSEIFANELDREERSNKIMLLGTIKIEPKYRSRQKQTE